MTDGFIIDIPSSYQPEHTGRHALEGLSTAVTVDALYWGLLLLKQEKKLIHLLLCCFHVRVISTPPFSH